MKQLGLDYTFAYCWHVQGNPSPQQAIAAQLDYINKTRRLGILPGVVTVSQGWSGWHDEGSIWKIPPAQYKELLEKAKAVIRTFPATELGSKMLLLDNWNKFTKVTIWLRTGIRFRLSRCGAGSLLRFPEAARRFVARRCGHGTV